MNNYVDFNVFDPRALACTVTAEDFEGKEERFTNSFVYVESQKSEGSVTKMTMRSPPNNSKKISRRNYFLSIIMSRSFLMFVRENN